jgi:hypothetical protein
MVQWDPLNMFRQSIRCPPSIALEPLIQPSSSCTIRVRFKPSANCTINEVITITGTAGKFAAINLKGTAVDPVTLTPASLGFGTAAVGQTSAPKTVTVRIIRACP